MRKLLILLCFFTIEVNAFSEWQEEEIELEDNLIVEEKEFCYREKKIVDYLREIDFIYEYYDLNDYLIEYSDWQKEIDFTQEYEEKTNYYYQKMQKIRYVHFSDIRSPDHKFMLNRVIIANQGKKLEYDVICDNCPNDLAELVKNENAFYEGFYLTEESTLTFDLGDYYAVENLDFNIFISNEKHGMNTYEMTTSRDQKNIFTRIFIINWFSTNPTEFRWFQYSLLADAEVIDPLYEPRVQTDYLKEATKKMKTFSETLYREKHYLYKNYEYQLELVEKEKSDYCVIKYRYQIKEKNNNINEEENNNINEEEKKEKDKPIKVPVVSDLKPAIKKTEIVKDIIKNNSQLKEIEDTSSKNKVGAEAKEPKTDNLELLNPKEKETEKSFNWWLLILLGGVLMVVRKYVKN